MLSKLIIRNYALIEHSELDLQTGFTAITGETGAGKSILLEAFSLVLGSRARYEAIRHGQDKCIVEAVFNDYPSDIDSILEAEGLDQMNELILRREMLSSGRSRAFINDSPVGLAVLKAVGSRLVDIHGQAENLELLTNDYQIERLDLYAGNVKLLSEFQTQFKLLRSIEKQIDQMKEAASQVRKDQDYFQFQFDELEQAGLEGEDAVKVEEEFNQLEHAEDIQRALSTVKETISDEGRGAEQAIKAAIASLNPVVELSAQYKEIQSRLQSVLIELDDLQMEADAQASGVESNPARMEELRSVLDDLNRLMHKHGVNNVGELIDVKEEYRLKLEGIESYDSELNALEEKQAELSSSCLDLAEQLGKARRAASGEFAEKVIDQVRELGMPKAHMVIDVSKEEELNSRGLDKVQFMFNANGSEFLVPLNKVASGGEVSRLTLSIKSILNESDSTPTLIFDEIDTGVSGEVAKRIGALMRKLSGKYQIVSVTHLPGVAAKGHQHIKIKKQEVEGIAVSNLLELSEDERVSEIASMFSGNELNESDLESAKSLLGLN